MSHRPSHLNWKENLATSITINFRISDQGKLILDAAYYLIKTSELFQSEGIEIQQNWLENVTTIHDENREWSEFIEDTQPVREDSNNLIVVNGEETENVSFTEKKMIQMIMMWMIGVK